MPIYTRKGKIYDIPEDKATDLLSKYSDMRLATDKEMSDFENKRAEIQVSTPQEAENQSEQGRSTVESSVIKANKPQNYGLDYQMPVIRDYASGIKEPKIQLGKGKVSFEEYVNNLMDKMPISANAQFDIGFNEYTKDKQFLDSLGSDGTSDNVKQAIANDFREKYGLGEEAKVVDKKDIPLVGRQWLYDNQKDIPTTSIVQTGLSGGASYSLVEGLKKGNTQEQKELLEEYLSNTKQGREELNRYDNYVNTLKENIVENEKAIKVFRESGKAKYAMFDFGEGDKQRVALGQAERELEKSKDLLKAIEDGDSNYITQFANEAGRGFKDMVFSAVSLGLIDLGDAFSKKDTIDRIEGKMQNNEALTEEEALFTQSLANNQAIQEALSGKRTVAQQVAQGIEQSVPFMVGFGKFGALAKGMTKGGVAVSKGAISKTAQQAIKGGMKTNTARIGSRVANIGVDTMDAVVRSSAMAVMAPSTYADAIERNIGRVEYDINEEGKIRYKGTTDQQDMLDATLGAIRSAGIENIAEFSGFGMERGMGLLKATDLGKMLSFGIPKNKFYQGLNKAMRTADFKGTGYGFLEEQVGTILHSALGTGEAEWSDLVDPEQQWITFLTVASIGGGSTLMSATGERAYKYSVNQGYKTATDEFGKQFRSYDSSENNLDVTSFVSSLEDGTLKDQQETLAAILKNDEYSDSQKASSLNLYARTLQCQAFQGAKQAEIDNATQDVSEYIEQNANPSTNSIMTAKLSGQESPMQVVEGSIARNEDGSINIEQSDETIVYLDEEGNRKPISIKFVKELTEEISTQDAVAEAVEAVTQPIVARQENDEVRPYEEGEEVRVLLPNSDMSVMGILSGVNENGNYLFTEATTNQQMEIEPRQIVNEDNLMGVDNGAEVVYRDADGTRKTGIVTDMYSQRMQGNVFIGDDLVPVDSVVGIKNETEDIGNPVSEEELSNSQESVENGQEGKQNILPDIDTIIENAPKQKSGKVDYNALMESSPADFATVWESRSGAEATRDQLQTVSNNMGSQIEAEQKKLEKETDLNKIADVEDKVAELQARKQGIDEVVASRYQPEESTQVEESDREVDREATIKNGEKTASLESENTIGNEGSEKTHQRISADSIGEGDEGNIGDGIHQRVPQGANRSENAVDSEVEGESSNIRAETKIAEDVVTNNVLKGKDGQESDTRGNNGQTENVEGEGDFDSRAEGGIGEGNQYSETEETRRQELRVQEEALMSESSAQINEEKLVSLEDEAVSLGATPDQIADVFTPSDYIDLIEQLKDGQRERQTSNKGRNKEQVETDNGSGYSDQTIDQGVGERNRPSEGSRTEGQDSDSAGDGRIAEQKIEEPLVQTLSEKIEDAEAKTDTNPTEAQKEARNYKKGKVTIQGFDVSIEQPKGSERSGTDEAGNAWSTTMKNTYGYIRGTEGKDGDHIDVYLGNNPESQMVYVVDQVNGKGEFDEHKVMLGFDTIEEAREAYLSNYEEGWQGLGNITEVDVETFRDWTNVESRKIKPFAEYKILENRDKTDNTNKNIRFHSVNDIADATGSTMTEEARIELDMRLKRNVFKIREAWEDKHLAVKKFLDVLRGRGTKIDEFNDYYLQATQQNGKIDAQLDYYRNRLQKPLNNAIGKLKKAGLEYRGIENYAILKHGLERNAWMRENAIKEYQKNHPDASPEQIGRFAERLPEDFAGVLAVEEEVGKTAKEFIEEFESKAGKGFTKNFWSKVRNASQFSLKKQVEGGLLSRAVYNELVARYDYYIPLRGHDDAVAEDRWDYSPVMGTYFVNPMMKANGRKTRAEKPFAFIAQQAQSSINSSNRNILNQTLLRLANKDKTGLMSVNKAWYELVGEEDGQPLWEQKQAEYSENPETYRKNMEMFEEKMEKLAEAGQAFRSGGKLDVGGLFIKKKQAEQHEVHIYQNGTDFVLYINANPAVAKAMNGSNIQETPKMLEPLAKMSRFVDENFMARNPQGMIKNISHDYLFTSSMLPVKESLTYTLKFQANMPAAASALQRYVGGETDLTKQQDQYLTEYILGGAKAGFSHIVELQKMEKQIRRGIEKGEEINLAEKTLEALSAANDFADNLSRLSVYITSREQGRSITRSVSDAKEVTVNLNRTGAGGYGAAFARPLYLFVNAGVQAMSNFSKVAVENPKKTTAMVSSYAMSGALIAPLISQMIGGDDGLVKYMKLEEKERQDNFCIYTGKGFIKIPLPDELRVFHRAGDNIFHAFMGKKDITQTMIDIPMSLLDLVAIDPSILQRMTEQLDELRADDGVGQGLKSKNPDVLEHFGHDYFGGLYNIGMQGVDISSKTGEFAATGEFKLKVGDTPLKTLDASPDDLRLSSSALNSKYDDISNEVNDVRRKVKEYEKQLEKQLEKMKLGEISAVAYVKKQYEIEDKIKQLNEDKVLDVYSIVQEINDRQKDFKDLSDGEQKEAERIISKLKEEAVGMW